MKKTKTLYKRDKEFLEPRLVRVVSACVANPNTPETDSQEFVPHDVTVELKDGVEAIVRVVARDPMDAMETVQKSAIRRPNA